MPAKPDNLVLRAARALAAEAGVTAGAHLVLDKHLPVASGIGGGSADAAATLRLLCRLWRLAPDPAALARLAARLGADVPVCLAGRAARMGGIGERLEPAPTLPACGIVLVNPGVARGDRRGVPRAARRVVRAGGAAGRAGTMPRRWRPTSADCATTWSRPPSRLRPVIGEVLAALEATPGCLLARMSGSGATCFGLFADAAAAGAARRRCSSRAGGAGAGPATAAERGFTSRGTRPIHAVAGWGVAKG